VRLYVEGVRLQNFHGIDGRSRDFLSASADYLTGPWILDATTTQRWTRDRTMPLQKDRLFTMSVGYKVAGQTIVTVSVAAERVDQRHGLYAGIRLTQTLTTCNRCMVRGTAY
jgi:hypothetical protein